MANPTTLPGVLGPTVDQILQRVAVEQARAELAPARQAILEAPGYTPPVPDPGPGGLASALAMLGSNIGAVMMRRPEMAPTAFNYITERKRENKMRQERYQFAATEQAGRRSELLANLEAQAAQMGQSAWQAVQDRRLRERQMAFEASENALNRAAQLEATTLAGQYDLEAVRLREKLDKGSISLKEMQDKLQGVTGGLVNVYEVSRQLQDQIFKGGPKDKQVPYLQLPMAGAQPDAKTGAPAGFIRIMGKDAIVEHLGQVISLQSDPDVQKALFRSVAEYITPKLAQWDPLYSKIGQARTPGEAASIAKMGYAEAVKAGKGKEWRRARTGANIDSFLNLDMLNRDHFLWIMTDGKTGRPPTSPRDWTSALGLTVGASFVGGISGLQKYLEDQVAAAEKDTVAAEKEQKAKTKPAAKAPATKGASKGR